VEPAGDADSLVAVAVAGEGSPSQQWRSTDIKRDQTSESQTKTETEAERLASGSKLRPELWRGDRVETFGGRYVKEWNLQVRDIHPLDEGEYRCTINTNPVKSKVVILHVKGMSFADHCTDVERYF